MIMTKGTYGTKVSLKINQDGRCLATLLMPGGVAGFPALRFPHDFLSMQPILQSVVSFHWTTLHVHIKSLWFEMISIIKVSARLSLHPRQGCHFPCPPQRSAAQKYSQGLEVWDLRTSTRLRVVPGPVLGYQVDIQKERVTKNNMLMFMWWKFLSD